MTVRGNVCNENNLKKYLKDLEKRGLRILRIVVFGKISIIKKINKSVEAYPYIILGHSNNSKSAAEKCGIEIVAAKGEFDDFEYIEFGQKIVGVYFKVSDREYLYVSGLGMAKTLRKIGFREEVRKTYELIDSINARYKFSAQNIYRFWNCMENILGNILTTNYNQIMKNPNVKFTKQALNDESIDSKCRYCYDARIYYDKVANFYNTPFSISKIPLGLKMYLYTHNHFLYLSVRQIKNLLLKS